MIKSRDKFPWSHLSTLQCSDKGTALIATGANCLRPALPEQAGHGGFVCQAERPPLLERKNKTHIQQIILTQLNVTFSIWKTTQSLWLGTPFYWI